MYWIGPLIGGYIGSRLLAPMGMLFSFVGCIAGAMIGGRVEHSFRRGRRQPGRGPHAGPAGNGAMIFYASVAAMLAKMAKADGVVTRAEIARVEEAFRRLGFSPAARQYAINVFRKAKDDGRSIYDYARDFASAVPSIEVREFLYEILWDLACSDGGVSPAELVILQRIPRFLGIRTEWYGYFYSRSFGGYRNRGSYGGASAADDPLADAYAVLGASANDSADELKRKYRELAKKNHPDALRAQGLPEEMVGKATERMSRINAAWATIREARGI